MSRHRKIGLALLVSAAALLVGVELLLNVGKAATLAGIVTAIGLAFSALVLWTDEI